MRPIGPRPVTGSLLASGIVAALSLAAAFAQPRVTAGSLEIAPGTLPGYLAAHIRAAERSSPGVHLEAGTGLCFEGSAAPSTTFACFRRALAASGLAGSFDGSRAYTVFAPTDAAFSHLARTLRDADVRRLTSDRAAASAMVGALLVPGSHTLGAITFGTSVPGRASSLPTVSGGSLRIVVGDGAPGASGSVTVAVGPPDGLDGQAHASGVSVLFPDGSVLVPLDRVPLALPVTVR